MLVDSSFMGALPGALLLEVGLVGGSFMFLSGQSGQSGSVWWDLGI